MAFSPAFFSTARVAAASLGQGGDPCDEPSCSESGAGRAAPNEVAQALALSTLRRDFVLQQRQQRQQQGDAAGEEACPVPDEFLRKCLVYQLWDTQASLKLASGFLRFRQETGWPMRIRAGDVEVALRTGLLWLLPPPRAALAGAGLALSAGRLRDPAWEDGGPGACLVFNMAHLDPQRCSIAKYQESCMFLMEQATDSAATMERGIALVGDFRGMQLSRLFGFLGTGDIARGVALWKGAFPCRLRRIWLLDPPPGLQALTSLVSRLLSPKVRGRIRIAWRNSGGLEQLAEDLGPIAELPGCLGGTGTLEPNWDAAVAKFLSEAPRVDREGGGAGPWHEPPTQAARQNAASQSAFCCAAPRQCCG